MIMSHAYTDVYAQSTCTNICRVSELLYANSLFLDNIIMGMALISLNFLSQQHCILTVSRNRIVVCIIDLYKRYTQTIHYSMYFVSLVWQAHVRTHTHSHANTHTLSSFRDSTSVSEPFLSHTADTVIILVDRRNYVQGLFNKILHLLAHCISQLAAMTMLPESVTWNVMEWNTLILTI